MPTWAKILTTIAVVCSVLWLVYQIKLVRLRRRNLIHWEKGEPLEGGVDRWD
ncbi:MAG: hypothetical protein SGI86_00910 [Deltaproteobacteria bacterium]|jgi:hypothetical protein|nr:hypothetical protein [Deltaproteobacteria bacterium]